MTYAPIWPDWAKQTRAVIDEFEADLPDKYKSDLQQVANYMGEQLREEFPDLDPTLVGWITVRAASHLGGFLTVTEFDVRPSTIAMIALLAGDYLVESAR